MSATGGELGFQGRPLSQLQGDPFTVWSMHMAPPVVVPPEALHSSLSSHYIENHSKSPHVVSISLHGPGPSMSHSPCPSWPPALQIPAPPHIPISALRTCCLLSLDSHSRWSSPSAPPPSLLHAPSSRRTALTTLLKWLPHPILYVLVPDSAFQFSKSSSLPKLISPHFLLSVAPTRG